MIPLRATSMPKVRDSLRADKRRIAHRFGDPAYLAAIRQKIDQAERDRLDNMLGLWRSEESALAISPLWWVNSDMTTVATDAYMSTPQEDLPAWYPETMEDARGLLVWDGGVPITFHDRSDDMRPIRIDAVSWMPHTADSAVFDNAAERRPFWLRPWTRAPEGAGEDDHGPLYPLSDHAIASTGRRVFLQDVLWELLQVTMRLAHEPKVGGVRPANLRTDGSPKEKRDRPVPDVSVIDLRTVRDWAVGPDGAAASSDGSREYSHRWIVRGHVQTYHVGPGRARSEKRWIAPYIAGPEGAPLMPKEQVWAWRR